MNIASKEILISVGEASGDLHASNLIKSVLQIDPTIKFYGMGGTLMQQAGAELLLNCNELALIGVFEIITKLPKILRAKKIMQKALLQDKPDLLILVDYAGFNLRLAKYAKKLGIKVLYYISPKLWASLPGRVKKIKRDVDLMAVIFPFEVEFYKKWQVPVKFAGNPLVEIVKPSAPKIISQNKIIGLLPGSRKSEIKYLLPVMLKAAEIIKKQEPTAQFVLPLASSLTEKDINKYLQNTSLKIQITYKNTYDVMYSCDAIIAASGTATLEIALLAIPMVITYKVSTLNYWLIKAFIKIPYVGLCNIVAQEKIVQELLQHDATPEKLSAEILKILHDENYRQNMITQLQKIKMQLDGSNKENIAEIIINIMKMRP